MSIQRATPVNEFLAKLVFLMLPTSVVAWFLLNDLNQYFSILENDALRQALFFAAGMGLSALFHSFRFRFLPAFAVLVLALYSVYKGLDNYAVGEFDSFFIARRFQVFAILGGAGWVTGWGFARLRYWSVGVAVSLLCACIAVIAKSRASSVSMLVMSFAPAVLYAIYLLFATEQIYNYKDNSKKYWWFLTARLVGFLVLAILMLGTVTYMMRRQIEEAVANYGGGGATGSDSTKMLHKKADGSQSLNDFQKLQGHQGRGKELLFCAHIENYFPGTNEPNPLYLTSFYFTKFDTATETFERDPKMPFNDLFEPDPSKLALFATKSDSSVLVNTLGDDYRKVVETEVYSKGLSPETYLAPNSGFFVQPITIEKDFRAEFHSAYRAKSYSSLLNSAYFVYNINKPEWRKFQEMRNQVLRRVTDYSKVDPAFMAYYTQMPQGSGFRRIASLAHSVSDSAHTPVDKVIAIRDYFLSKDAQGEPLYVYTDNPGEPDIPSASKLQYFLFENHKGYCAYYAGATLFMLRALGIPSRIAVGFLTENRADKNKCWYWYYAKQAHAWVQVYFPGLGWLDFDTTVGNNEAHESPAPDGTPPMQPPRAWLAAEATIEAVDTAARTARVAVSKFVFHDKEYMLPGRVSLKLDMKIAQVYRDSVTIPLASVRSGDEGTVVSYAEALKTIEPSPSETATGVIHRLPAVVPVDEIYLRSRDGAKKKAEEQVVAAAHKDPIRELLVRIVALVLAGLVLAVTVPWLIFLYYKTRSRMAGKPEQRAYWVYMASLYYLHMLGYPLGDLTPLRFATTVVDPAFGTGFGGFMNAYLKTKYANQPLTAAEVQRVDTFLLPFLTLVRSRVPRKQRLKGFVNPVRSALFFSLREDEEKMA
jgi:protein-glutamine gamma-glutamyltransferase